MRTTLTSLAVLLALTQAAAATSGRSTQTFNVQGVLRDGTGALQSMAVAIDINLYVDNQPSTTPFFSQHVATVPVDNGFFSVEIGGPSLSFDTADAWVGVQIGGDPTELPRQHINSVPYALSAVSATHAGTAAAIQNVAVSATAPTDGQLLQYSAATQQWTPVSPAALITVQPIGSDQRNNAAHSTAGQWYSLPDRLVQFTKRFNGSALRIVYQDTLGTLGQYYDGCEWQILLDSTQVAFFSGPDADSANSYWHMANAAHMVWSPPGAVAAGPHSVTVQNRGVRGAWAAGTSECLAGWNLTGSFLMVEEVP